MKLPDGPLKNDYAPKLSINIKIAHNKCLGYSFY
ncbi:hypothetical protein J2Y43_001509 [Dyadobacter sp. BE31]|nr:hypothetical protein [Dyadobacter sp. BE31]